MAVAGDYPGRPEAGSEAAVCADVAASDPYLGETRIFAFPFAPAGWYYCQGSLFPVSENQQLFSLIGTTYGGDGTTTFGLPNVTGPESPDGPLNVCISLFGAVPAAGAEVCA
ncbi:MAG: hypothetical protein E6G94_16330 [Alphaproteobacteria bacterium]|nr:MAG: hypothetical protein E6G94_16330 [Alphaproteobacteria bacterium]